MQPSGGSMAIGLAANNSPSERLEVVGNVKISGVLKIGTSTPNTEAQLSAIASGDNLEWGNPNASGYRSSLGNHSTSGTNFLAFHGEGGSTTETFTTRGVKASILQANLLGGLSIGTVANANATNQTFIVNSTFTNDGKLYIGGSTTPTATLHLVAGVAAANGAAIKLTSGVASQTTKEAGAVNYDGSDITLSDATYAYTLDKSLVGSATLDFGNTAAGVAADLTITVTGAADGDVVTLGVPNGSVSATDNVSFFAWVSATNTVTVRFNNNNLVNAVNPASGTFKVRVTK